MRHICIWILMATVSVGCAQLDKNLSGGSSIPTKLEREKVVEKFSEFTPEQRAKFLNGEAWIGMSELALQEMWGSRPTKSQKKIGKEGAQEIQIYHLRKGDWTTGIVSHYYKVTIQNGKVTELQEIDPKLGSYDNL